MSLSLLHDLSYAAIVRFYFYPHSFSVNPGRTFKHAARSPTHAHPPAPHTIHPFLCSSLSCPCVSIELTIHVRYITILHSYHYHRPNCTHLELNHTQHQSVKRSTGIHSPVVFLFFCRKVPSLLGFHNQVHVIYS